MQQCAGVVHEVAEALLQRRGLFGQLFLFKSSAGSARVVADVEGPQAVLAMDTRQELGKCVGADVIRGDIQVLQATELGDCLA